MKAVRACGVGDEWRRKHQLLLNLGEARWKGYKTAVRIKKYDDRLRLTWCSPIRQGWAGQTILVIDGSLDAPHVVEDEVQNGIIVQNLSSCTFYPAASRIDDGVHVVRLAIPVCRLRPEMQGSRRPFDGVGRRRLSVNLVEIGDRRGRARPMNLHVSHNSVETGERCAVFAPGSKLSAHGPAGMVVASSIM